MLFLVFYEEKKIHYFHPLFLLIFFFSSISLALFLSPFSLFILSCTTFSSQFHSCHSLVILSFSTISLINFSLLTLSLFSLSPYSLILVNLFFLILSLEFRTHHFLYTIFFPKKLFVRKYLLNTSFF